MADQPETRDVGGAVHGAGELSQHVGAALFSIVIDATALATRSSAARAFLDRGADDAGAEPLGEDETIADARAGVGPDAIGIDGAGDGVAELHFGVAHRVAAEQRDAGFAQLVVAAEEDLLDRLGVEDLVGKAAMASAVTGVPPIA